MNIERPPVETVGHTGEWRLPTETDHAFTVRGRFLGMGTSQRPDHTHQGTHPRGRCPACRWFEVRIFWDEERREYVVYKVGVSVVPGESDRPSVDVNPSPYAVVETLTTRHSRRPNEHDRPSISIPAARALATAAGFDEGIEKAWVDRAVV